MSLTNRYKLKVWRNPADKFTPTINEDDISETKLIAYLNILSTNIKAHASEPLVHRIEIQIIEGELLEREIKIIEADFITKELFKPIPKEAK